MAKEKILFTSESVTEGHPDKICDQISDAILDALMAQDPMSRVACETSTTTGLVLVMGEITTQGYVDIQKIVRDTIREIGYTRGKYGFDADNCAVITAIDEQSTDIAMGVDKAMAGKGTEIGRTFEELAQIYDGVVKKDRLRVCFDTCHTHDAGYDIINNFDSVIDTFDHILGKDQIAVFHINDSKNPCGAHKDRHENLGKGYIGFDALSYIVHHPDFSDVPKILETPWIPIDGDKKNTRAPYKEEIALLRGDS